MYRSDFFYQEPPFPTFLPTVLSFWSVTADKYYSYEPSVDDEVYYGENAYSLIYSVVGSGKVITKDERECIVGESEVLILPHNSIYKYCSNNENWNYKWVNFYFNTADKPPLSVGIVYSVNNTKIDTLFDEIYYEGKVYKHKAMVNLLFAQLCYMLVIKQESNNEPTDKFDEMLSFVEQKYFLNIKTSDIATYAKVSVRRVNQLFRDKFNITPTQYIRNLRIERAKKALRSTNYHISEIAYALSFDSALYFSNVFKSVVGMSPRQYREMTSKEEMQD